MVTVRFAKVVAECGQPEVHLLWTPPKKDAALQKAIAENRVLLIHQNSVGTKQDFGEVGFEEGVRGQILIFPKPLAAYVGKRIVGIQYEMLESATEPEPAETAVPNKSKKAAPPEKPLEATPAPKPKPVKKPARKKPSAPEPPKLIPFVAENSQPAAPDDEDIQSLRQAVQKAIEALEEGRHVAAYQILQRIARD